MILVCITEAGKITITDAENFIILFFYRAKGSRYYTSNLILNFEQHAPDSIPANVSEVAFSVSNFFLFRRVLVNGYTHCLIWLCGCCRRSIRFYHSVFQINRTICNKQLVGLNIHILKVGDKIFSEFSKDFKDVVNFKGIQSRERENVALRNVALMDIFFHLFSIHFQYDKQ